MVRVGILGAKGYSAGEVLRWLLMHPQVEITCLMARVEKPEPISNYFPALRDRIHVPVEPVNLDLLAERCDAAFLALPHTTSQEYARSLIKAGVKVIDLSADFRFDTVEGYEKTYAVTHQAPELNSRFPYALPELFRDEIPGSAGLACPGCYPTTTILGLAPLMTRPGEFDLDHIVVNAMSGVSGAGRKAEERYSFVECNESVAAYSVGNHRHRPEIEEKLGRLASRPLRITFTTHLIPMNRGILATSTVPLIGDVEASKVHARFEEFYAGEPFVRVLPMGKFPATADIVMTNFCDIGLTVDKHSKVLIVVSVADNLGKGAASQAIQGMNALFGLPETLGLLPEVSREATARA